MVSRKKVKKLVIGGGISGLGFAFYHMDSVVVAEESIKKDSPFVFIQENQYTSSMCVDLGLPTDSEDVMVYPREADDVVKDKVGGLRSFFSGTDRIANIGEGFILKVISLRESQIVAALYEAVRSRVIHGKVVRIDGNVAFLESGDSIEYEELISTMHFKAFEKVYGGWECGDDIQLVKMYIDEVEDKSVTKNKIAYNCAKGISKMVENRITGSIGYELLDGKDREGSCREMSRFKGLLNPPPKNVTFVGRFATANPHWRIEDSIFIAQNGYMFSKMLNEQKRFDKAVDYANRTKALDRSKDLALHIHSEVSELVRELNLKTNRKEQRPVKATNILEEGIDIIKLVYGILNMYNYTEREIVEMFFSKTQKVWDRFLGDFYGGI
jgi:hypothetical protein